MCWFPICYFSMSEQWFSASEEVDSGSESDQEERRDWVQERARSMSRGRGSVRPSDRPAQVGRDTPYMREGNPIVNPYAWENPLQGAGIGRGLSSAEVMRQATASYSRLVREMAVKKSPETEASVMATRDSRPVREEVVDKVSVGSPKEPVVFRGRSRSREAFPVATPGVAHISKPSGDVEFPPGRRDNRDSLCPVPGCGMWTRKMKDHAFKVHLSPFFQLPAKVTGVDKTLFRQLGEALEMVGRLVCGPSSGANDLLDLVNSKIRFPRQCSIPMECTLAMREVDIAMGWKLVDSPQVNPLNNPACLLHLRVLLTTLQWLDRTRQEAVREYTPVLSSSICRYEPIPAPVVQKVPTCVVEEPEDWMGEYPDTPSQPFQLREFRTGQLVGVMASSIRDLQILAQQHFSVRDPVIATDGAALIGSDGYLMSLRRDAVVVAVPRHVWDRLC